MENNQQNGFLHDQDYERLANEYLKVRNKLDYLNYLKSTYYEINSTMFVLLAEKIGEIKSNFQNRVFEAVNRRLVMNPMLNYEELKCEMENSYREASTRGGYNLIELEKYEERVTIFEEQFLLTIEHDFIKSKFQAAKELIIDQEQKTPQNPHISEIPPEIRSLYSLFEDKLNKLNGNQKTALSSTAMTVMNSIGVMNYGIGKCKDQKSYTDVIRKRFQKYNLIEKKASVKRQK